MRNLLSLLLVFVIFVTEGCKNKEAYKSNITLPEISDSVILKFGEGIYVLPLSFTKDFGSKDIYIEGIPGKTIITSYDGTPQTNFKPTAIDTNLPDSFPNGLYVVANHTPYSYGGGFAHLNLKDSYNTGGIDCFYTMGTILQKTDGVWSRHFSGYGFKTKGSITVKNVIFSNCAFYIFSPFNLTGGSERFEIRDCEFKNVARVISSMSYGGINQKPDWCNSLQNYPSNGTFRFNDFTIENCKFDSIYTSIVWGFPPSKTTKIKGNVIRNSTTMISAFNLYMKCYGNEGYFTDKSNQVISENIFEDIITKNSNTTSLIRTSGIANINNNHFINCSQQIYFSGGNTIFANNTVNKWNDGAELQSPVILIKANDGINTITNNIITAPMSTMVALEGTSSVVIHNNVFKGLSRWRMLDTKVTEVRNEYVYYLTDLNKLKSLATVDTNVVTNSHIYFDKVKNKWVKTKINLIGFVFSKSNATSSPSQFLKITNNLLDAEGITNVSGSGANTFNYINISGNEILNARYLHLGLTTVNDYIYSNNYINNSIYPLTGYTQIKNFTIK